MAKRKTASRTSPKTGKRACLCDNGTYSSKCCDGSLQAQGIGSLSIPIDSTVNNINTVRTLN